MVGNKLAISGIDWSQSQQTLLLVLQKGCRYCEESVPFYQRLTKEISSQPKTRLIALLPGRSGE